MRISRLAMSFVCLLSLSACSTWEGFKQDVREHTTMQPGNNPKTLQVPLPPAPKGYSGQNRRGLVLKPPGAAGSGIARTDESGLVWHEVGSYDVAEIIPGTVEVDLSPITNEAPEMTTPAGGDIAGHDGAVTVFPLDGAIVAGGTLYAPAPPPRYAASPALYGPPEAQVFFAHGSAIVKKSDKAKLKKVATRAKKKKNVEVTVVGHASKRVDGVRDPVERSMINLAMAQKRADAVMKELTRAGLSPGWVRAVSKGDEEPNPDPRDMPQEVADRRAEVYMDER